MSWNVYVNGDIEMMAGAYNGVAMLFNDSSSLSWAAGCLALLALMWGAAKKILNDKDSPVVNLFVGLLLFSCLIAKDDVTLENPRTGQVITVDNVPLLVAATGGISTSIFSTVIEKMRTAFTAINPYDTTSVQDASGGLDPLRAIVTASQLGYQGGNLCRPKGSNIDYCTYIKNYSADCIARDIATGGPAQQTSVSKLMHATPAELLSVMKVSTSTWTLNRPKTYVAIPDVVTCNVAYQQIHSYITGQTFEASMQKFSNAHGITDEAMQDAMSMLMTSNLAAYDLNRARFLQTQIISGLPKGAAIMGPQVAAELSQFQAQEARLVQMGSQYKMYNQLAPAMITAFEFFAIFVAPLVLILTAAGRFGFSILINYLGLVFTLNVWPLAAVLVDSFLQYSILRDMNAMNTDMTDRAASLSWSALPDTVDSIQTYLAVGSSLTALAPVMFFSLFKIGQSSIMSGGGRELAPNAPVDTGYVAPSVATAANAGTTRAGQMSATADLAHQGNQVVSSSSGPLAGEMTTGAMTTAALSKQIQAMEGQVASEGAAIGRSLMENLTRGTENGDTSGISSKESASDIMAKQAALAAVGAYASDKGISTEQALAIMSTASRADQASMVAGLNLGGKTPGPVSASAKVGGDVTGTSTDTDSASDSTASKEGQGVKIANGFNTNTGETDLASIQRGLELAKGSQHRTSSGQSSGSSELTQRLNQYANQRSHLEQLSNMLSSQSSMGVGAKDDIADRAQRATGFSMQQTLADTSQYKDALMKAGLLSSDGGLSTSAQSAFEGTIAAVGNASQNMLQDHGALERIAGAKTMISAVQDLFKSGDASQVAAGTAIVNSMIAQGYDSAAMRELSKVGSEIVAANNGEDANKQWGSTGEEVNKQLQGAEQRVNEQQIRLQENFNNQNGLVQEKLNNAPGDIEAKNKEDKKRITNKGEENQDAISPAAVAQGKSKGQLEDLTGQPVPQFGPKPTEADQFVSASNLSGDLVSDTNTTLNKAAQNKAEAQHKTDAGILGTFGLPTKEEIKEEEAAVAAKNASPEMQALVATAKPGERETTLLNRQQELQGKMENGSATQQEQQEYRRNNSELKMIEKIRENQGQHVEMEQSHSEAPLAALQRARAPVDEAAHNNEQSMWEDMNK